jgi:hypothetical protein
MTSSILSRLPRVLLAALFSLALLAAGPAGTVHAASTCPVYNPPSELVLAAGTPQSAPLGTPFQTGFRVALAASNGCPITTSLAGVAVTFTAPGSGPSGIFASSGTSAALVGTDESGTATAPTYTANLLPGGYLVVATSALGSVVFSVVNTPSGVPATIKPLSPASQSATVGARFPKPLRAKVLDANGDPVQGASVAFSLGTGGTFDGGAPQVTEPTNDSGIATSPPFAAGETAGTFTATATVAGITAPARFTLRDLALKAPRLSLVGGGSRSAVVGTGFRSRIEVKARDGAGHPLAGATVTFSLGAGSTGATAGGAGSGGGAGASFAGGAPQATEATNARGIAMSPRFSANTTAGAFTATATLMGGGTVAVTLHNRPGRARSLMPGAAATESTTVGTRFPIRLAVTVTDQDGNPVAGVRVRFSAPGAGASGRFAHRRRTATAKTNAAGIAVAPALVANHTPGGFVVRATAAGHSAAFALVNQPPGG